MNEHRIEPLTTTEKLAKRDAERALLGEIGALSRRLRELRATSARPESVQVKALEGESRAKWQELRLLRAGPMNEGPSAPERRGHYR
jgi:hypothetical protein